MLAASARRAAAAAAGPPCVPWTINRLNSHSLFVCFRPRAAPDGEHRDAWRAQDTVLKVATANGKLRLVVGPGKHRAMQFSLRSGGRHRRRRPAAAHPPAPASPRRVRQPAAMDQLLAMMNSMGSMLGGRDMLTGERWQPPPLTAAQRQLDRAMTSGGVDAMQAVLAANPDMDVNFHTEQGGFTLLHMAVSSPRRGCKLAAAGACLRGAGSAPAPTSRFAAFCATLCAKPCPSFTPPRRSGPEQPGASGGAAAGRGC